MPTSSNPPIPSSDFQPFRPIPLLPSTAFKQKSQVHSKGSSSAYSSSLFSNLTPTISSQSAWTCGSLQPACLLLGSAGPSLRTPLQMRPQEHRTCP